MTNAQKAHLRGLRLGLLGLLASLPAVSGCIATVGLERTPCPCADGFVCCESLALCVRAAADCPAVRPASSKQACTYDDDCPIGEACASWTLTRANDETTLSGPRICRRSCENPTYSCAEGEVCGYSLHDAGPSEMLALARLCVERAAEGACKDWVCTGCEGYTVGETRCDPDLQMRACAVGVHAECGVACSLVPVGFCDSGAVPDEPLCQAASCESCLSDGIGDTECRDGQVFACAFAHAPTGESCSAYCVNQAIATCPNGCLTSPGGHAVCAP